jgi:hypothetical protein
MYVVIYFKGNKIAMKHFWFPMAARDYMTATFDQHWALWEGKEDFWKANGQIVNKVTGEVMIEYRLE